MRCEGWKRRGGVFTLGPMQWSQCENDATVMLTVAQEKEETLSACNECWKEGIERGITIIKAEPISAGGDHER